MLPNSPYLDSPLRSEAQARADRRRARMHPVLRRAVDLLEQHPDERPADILARLGGMLPLWAREHAVTTAFRMRGVR